MDYIDRKTGEIIDLKARFNEQTDKATIESTNLRLSEEEVVALRKTTNALTSIQIVAGIATGVIVGKTIFTGACISIGAMVIADMVTPTDLIYKKVLTNKTK